jgi:nitrogen fixation/metabolism regulation signal transduction histidine kinase
MTSLLGVYYLSHFSSQADQRLREQIKVPGILMNKGLLNYDAISNRDTMKKILGGDVAEAMVFGYDGTIYQSINKADLSKTIDQLGRLQLGNYSSAMQDVLVNGKNASGDYLGVITPIYTVAGKAPFLFAYIEIQTQSLHHEKDMLTLVILASSLSTIVLTSLTIFLLLRLVVLRQINKLRHAAELVSRGQLGPDVISGLPHTKDELGKLSDAFRSMINEIENSYRELAEKQARLRASIDSLTLGFIMVDHDREIANINPAALRLFLPFINPKKPSLDKLQAEMLPAIDLFKSIDECLTAGR